MTNTTVTPAHLHPTACYVCGGTEAQHPRPSTPSSTHAFWSNADAMAEADAYDRRMVHTTTPEARYVATYRPY